jgi:hypothetical protein
MPLQPIKWKGEREISVYKYDRFMHGICAFWGAEDLCTLAEVLTRNVLMISAPSMGLKVGEKE